MSVKKLIVFVLIISWIQIPGIGWSKDEKSLKDVTREFMEKQKEDANDRPTQRRGGEKNVSVSLMLLVMGGMAEWGAFVWTRFGLEELAKIKNPPIYKIIKAVPPTYFEAGSKIAMGATSAAIGVYLFWRAFVRSGLGGEFAANFGSEVDNLKDGLRNKVVADAFVNVSEKANALIRAPQNSLVQEEFLLHQVLLSRAQEKPAEEIEFWTSEYVDVRDQQKTLTSKDQEAREVALVYAQMQQDQVRETITAAIAQ